MAKKIERLTAEQELLLVKFRQEMWARGTCCAPTDRVMAERAITEAYAIVNRPAPKFFWMPSPMSSALALYVLRKFADDVNLRDGLGDGLRDGLGAGLWAGLRAGLGDGLRAGLWAGLGAGLGAGLRDGLWDGLRAGLRDGLGAGLRDGLWDGLRDGLWDGLRAGLRDGLWAGLGDGLRAGLGDGLWDGLGAGLGDGLRAGLGDGLRAGLRDGLGDGLWDGLGDGLWAGLGAGLGDGLRAGLGDGLRDGLRDGLGDGLRDGLGDGLRAGLRDGLRDGLRAGLADGLRDTYWWGQMDTYWLAFYRFGSMIGCPQWDKLLLRLDIMERIAASCGFWYPRDGVCIISDRFAGVSWDESRNRVGLPFRLHRADGPAISFRDGWCQYYWHGLRLPESHHWLITHRERMQPDAIDLEKNAELRRVMLEIFGFERYLGARQGRVVSQDELHGFPRRLHEVQVGGEPVRIIEVINGSLEPDGSRRKFHLGAMRGDTPHEVIANSYGIAPSHYREAVRT